MHPYLDFGAPIPFAHRGGASAAPENTLAAFRDAAALGYQYIETDVHVTSDGTLVAFHDNDLSRTCGIDSLINETPWKEIRGALVNGQEPIPLLEDVLGEFPDMRVNIDCKSEEALEPLVAAIRRTKSLHRVCIGSFSDSRLRRIRDALGSESCTSAGPVEVGRLIAGSRAGSLLGRRLASRLEFAAAQVPISQGPIPVVSERFIDFCHRMGLHVHVWTIDDPATMNRLLDLGVDGIMTDDTRALKDVMTSRGQWR